MILRKLFVLPLLAAILLIAPLHRAAQAHDLVEIAASNSDFSTLVAAVRAANLTHTLKEEGPYTIFAPTNAAFAKLPRPVLEALLRPENRDKLTAILTYHVLPVEVLGINASRLKNGAKVTTVNGAKLTLRNRSGLQVDNANITRTDLLGENGVIHVIDTVLLPPGLDLSGLTASATDTDIVDTAIKAGSFKTLTAALKAAGLVDTLKGKGPFTVFAPTDEAFAKLPRGTVEALLRPENRDKLTAILTYHVLSREVRAARIQQVGSAGATARTVNGAELRVRNRDNGRITIDDATVVKADIVTKNGVIHIIDSVLMPPGMEIK